MKETEIPNDANTASGDPVKRGINGVGQHGPTAPENPQLDRALREAFDRSWEKYEAVYRRLGR